MPKRKPKGGRRRTTVINKTEKQRPPHPALNLTLHHLLRKRHHPEYRVFPRAGLVWLPTKTEGYVLAKVLKSFERGHHGQLLVVDEKHGAQVIQVSGKRSLQLIPADYSGDSSTNVRINPNFITDLDSQIDISVPSLLHHIRARYKHGKRVSRIGPTLVLMNAYEDVENDVALNESLAWEAREMFHHLYKSDVDQSIIFTGETCSGKSTFSKLYLRKLLLSGANFRSTGGKETQQPQRMSLSRRHSRRGSSFGSTINLLSFVGDNTPESLLSSRLDDVNVILEVLSGAKTSQCASSTRCGTMIDLLYKGPFVAGASVNLHFLEKSRVIQQRFGESNFDVFYCLLAAASEQEDFARKIKLNEFDHIKYYFLNQGIGEDAQRERTARQKAEIDKKICIMPGCDLKPKEGSLQCRVHHSVYSGLEVDDPPVDEAAKRKSNRRRSARLKKQHSVIDQIDAADRWISFVSCLRTCGFTQHEVNNIAAVLSAILQLGNVIIAEVGENQYPRPEIAVTDESMVHLENVAKLLGIKVALLKSTFLHNDVKAGPDALRMPLSLDQAYDVRNTLAKGLYGDLVSWIILRLNEFMCAPRELEDWQKFHSGKSGAKSKSSYEEYWSNISTISVFNVFGFEAFEKQNSIEQLWVNFANEMVETVFRSVVLEHEQSRAEDMKIEILHQNKSRIFPALVETKLVDGNCCYSLLGERLSTGLFEIIDEETKAVNGTGARLLRKTLNVFAQDDKHSKLIRKPKTSKRRSLRGEDMKSAASSFTIVHYPGTVNYDVTDFLSKNKAGMLFLIKEALKQSKNEPIRNMSGNFSSYSNSLAKADPDAEEDVLSFLDPNNGQSLWQQLSKLGKKESLATKAIRGGRRLSALFKQSSVEQNKKKTAGPNVPEVSESSKRLSARTLSRANSFRGSITVGESGKLKTDFRVVTAKLSNTKSLFVKCIKINNIARRGFLDTFSVLTQIKSSGLGELAQIRNHGFTVSMTKSEFLYRYSALVPWARLQLTEMINALRLMRLSESAYDSEVAAIAIHEARTLNASLPTKHRKTTIKLPNPLMSGILQGETTVAMQPETSRELEIARSIALIDVAIFLQKNIRMFVTRKRIVRRLRTKIAIRLEMSIIDCSLDRLTKNLASCKRWGVATSVSDQAAKHLNYMLELKNCKEWLVRAATEKDRKALYDSLSKAHKLGLKRNTNVPEVDLAYNVSDQLYLEDQEKAQILVEIYQSEYCAVLNQLSETLGMMRTLGIVGKPSEMKKRVESEKDFKMTKKFLLHFYETVGAVDKLNDNEIEKIVKHFENRQEDLLQVLEHKYHVTILPDGQIVKASGELKNAVVEQAQLEEPKEPKKSALPKEPKRNEKVDFVKDLATANGLSNVPNLEFEMLPDTESLSDNDESYQENDIKTDRKKKKKKKKKKKGKRKGKRITKRRGTTIMPDAQPVGDAAPAYRNRYTFVEN